MHGIKLVFSYIYHLKAYAYCCTSLSLYIRNMYYTIIYSNNKDARMILRWNHYDFITLLILHRMYQIMREGRHEDKIFDIDSLQSYKHMFYTLDFRGFNERLHYMYVSTSYINRIKRIP